MKYFALQTPNTSGWRGWFLNLSPILFVFHRANQILQYKIQITIASIRLGGDLNYIYI